MMIPPSGRYIGGQWVPNNLDQMVVPKSLPFDKNTFDPDSVATDRSLNPFFGMKGL